MKKRFTYVRPILGYADYTITVEVPNGLNDEQLVEWFEANVDEIMDNADEEEEQTDTNWEVSLNEPVEQVEVEDISLGAE